MNFDDLYSNIENYLIKLENDFKFGEYDLEFIVKKLENYRLAVHQDIKFEIADRLNHRISQDNLCQVENSTEVGYIKNYENPQREDLISNIKVVISKIASYLNEYIENDRNVYVLYGRDIENDASEFEKHISHLLVKYISTDLSNTSFDKSKKRALMRFREKEFQKCFNNIKDLNKYDIIDEILDIQSKQKQIGEIPRVFSAYRSYFKECIDKYQKLFNELSNFGYESCESVEILESKEVEKYEKTVSPIIDTVEVTYTNGDKVKMSYTKICTPDQSLVLDEKFRLIEQKLKEVQQIIDDLKYLSD